MMVHMKRSKSRKSEPKESGDTSRNVTRIMAIVDVLAAAADEGLRLSDVMRATDLNKTTAHRLLAGLAANGLADQDAETGRFFIGVRLVALAQAAKRRFRLASLVEPALVKLARQTQDTVTLLVRSGDEAVCLDCREGAFPIKVLTLHAGDRRPLGVGAGSLALLAFLPDAEVERILGEHAQSRAAFPFDDIQLRQMIAAARRQGYAYNDVHVFKGMETITDMAAVGVPILSSKGTPVAALHLTAITQRLEQPRRDNIVTALRREAEHIETAFGPILDTMEPRPVTALEPVDGRKRGAAPGHVPALPSGVGRLRPKN
jgi:DNA-binding IclR family transcriptional regulator